MKIKIFKCLMCHNFRGTRKGLRDHLANEHGIRSEITNIKNEDQAEGTIKQRWWGTE